MRRMLMSSELECFNSRTGSPFILGEDTRDRVVMNGTRVEGGVKGTDKETSLGEFGSNAGLR